MVDFEHFGQKTSKISVFQSGPEGHQCRPTAGGICQMVRNGQKLTKKRCFWLKTAVFWPKVLLNTLRFGQNCQNLPKLVVLGHPIGTPLGHPWDTNGTMWPEIDPNTLPHMTSGCATVRIVWRFPMPRAYPPPVTAPPTAPVPQHGSAHPLENGSPGFFSEMTQSARALSTF